MKRIIEHFIKMKKQTETALDKEEAGEIGDWMRGSYCGQIQAYRHCIEYLSQHLTSAMNSDGEGSAVFEKTEYTIDYVDSETIRLTRCR